MRFICYGNKQHYQDSKKITNDRSKYSKLAQNTSLSALNLNTKCFFRSNSLNITMNYVDFNGCS